MTIAGIAIAGELQIQLDLVQAPIEQGMQINSAIDLTKAEYNQFGLFALRFTGVF